MSTNKFNFELEFELTLDRMLDENANIVVVLSDMGRCIFEDEFLDKHQKVIYNFGISEQNMISAAAGIASMGLTPIVITFASFLTQRAFDQISCSVAYPNANVKLIGIRPGLADKGGASHTALFDVALMRSLPNMKILAPSHLSQINQMMKICTSTDGPTYVRLSNEFSKIYIDTKYNICWGGSKKIKSGSDGAILAMGLMVPRAMQIANQLATEGIDLQVVDMYSLKPFDKERLRGVAKETNKVITIEEHSVIGGLNSLVSEFLSKENPTRILPIGVEDCYGTSGYSPELFKYFNLDNESIKDKIRQFIIEN